jgi:hypothetical protein
VLSQLRQSLLDGTLPRHGFITVSEIIPGLLIGFLVALPLGYLRADSFRCRPEKRSQLRWSVLFGAKRRCGELIGALEVVPSCATESKKGQHARSQRRASRPTSTRAERRRDVPGCAPRNHRQSVLARMSPDLSSSGSRDALCTT